MCDAGNPKLVLCDNLDDCKIHLTSFLVKDTEAVSNPFCCDTVGISWNSDIVCCSRKAAAEVVKASDSPVLFPQVPTPLQLGIVT